MGLTPIRTAFLLCFLPLRVIGLITTTAKCLSGYEWMFSSIGQSPCDVAAELATVCVGEEFSLKPLDDGYVYSGPSQGQQNSCRCSSVFYSLVSGCGHCQGRNYVLWSIYKPNCSTVFVAVYNPEIPVGVKVPAYAYQNVSISDTFNLTLAQSIRGVESSRTPSSSTASSAITNTDTAGSNGGSRKNTPAIIGGVVGGIACLGFLVLTLWILLRKRKLNSQTYNQSAQLSLTKDNTTPPFPPLVPAPGSPGSSQEPDLSSYPPSMNNPYRQNSPPFRFLTMTPNDTGNGDQN